METIDVLIGLRRWTCQEFSNTGTRRQISENGMQKISCYYFCFAILLFESYCCVSAEQELVEDVWWMNGKYCDNSWQLGSVCLSVSLAWCVLQNKVKRLPAYLTIQMVRFFYKGKEAVNAKILKVEVWLFVLLAHQHCETLQTRTTLGRELVGVDELTWLV